jgi:hypothetical protein
MCLDQFFGDQSPFQIIVAIVAFGTALYTFYKSFFERAKLSLYPGDRLGLVILSGGCWRFHLRASLVNHAVKTGTLHRLEAQITTPTEGNYLYMWHIFFEYVSGTLNVQPAGNATPVSIPGKNSKLLLTQFELTPVAPPPVWSPGRYEVKVRGWVNRANRGQRSNLFAIFHFSLDAAQSQKLVLGTPGQPVVIDVPIEEWTAQGILP